MLGGDFDSDFDHDDAASAASAGSGPPSPTQGGSLRLPSSVGSGYESAFGGQVSGIPDMYEDSCLTNNYSSASAKNFTELINTPHYRQFLLPLQQQIVKGEGSKFFGLPNELLESIKVWADIKDYVMNMYSNQNIGGSVNLDGQQRYIENTMSAASQYLRWLLQHPLFTLSFLSNDEEGVKKFATQVLDYKLVRLYFVQFWFPKKYSPYTNKIKLDGMTRY